MWESRYHHILLYKCPSYRAHCLMESMWFVYYKWSNAWHAIISCFIPYINSRNDSILAIYILHVFLYGLFYIYKWAKAQLTGEAFTQILYFTFTKTCGAKDRKLAQFPYPLKQSRYMNVLWCSLMSKNTVLCFKLRILIQGSWAIESHLKTQHTCYY